MPKASDLQFRLRQHRRIEVSQALDSGLRSVQEFDLAASEAESIVSSLISVPSESIGVAFGRALAMWREAGGDDTSSVDAMHLESSLLSMQDELERSRGTLETLEECEINVPLWRETRAREREAAQRLSVAHLPTALERADIELALDKAREEFAIIESDYIRLATPLEQLRTAGRSFLAEATVEQHCPLCTHDHESADDLRRAISAGLVTLPVSVEALTVRRETLNGQITGFEETLRRWADARLNAEAAAADLETARRVITNAATSFAAIDLTVDSLDTRDLDRRLADLRLELVARISQFEVRVSAQERLISAAQQLRAAAAEITGLTESVHSLVPEAAVVGNLDDEPPTRSLEVLKQTVEHSEAAMTQARVAATEHRSKAQELRGSLRLLTEEKESIETSVLEISKKLGMWEAERREFEEQWRVLAGEEPWSSVSLDLRTAELERLKEEVATAAQALESSRASLVTAVEIESEERERLSHQLELSKARLLVRELINLGRWRAECEHGVEMIRTAKDSFVTQQIVPLCDVITALYVRAQSNAFIDRIEPNLDKGPLRWLAQIGQQRLEDTVQMSRGQRQDLALAIFLARARELGGTFFLDEPLINLDDLNRVGLLDVLRTIVVEDRALPVRLVVTTANHSLVRQCREKFAGLETEDKTLALRVYRLIGNPRSGLTASEDT